MRVDPRPSPRTDTLIGLGAVLGLWLSSLGLAGGAEAALPAAIELGTNDTAAVTLSIPLSPTTQATQTTQTVETVSWLHPPEGVAQPPLDWRVVDEHMRVTFEVAAEGLDDVPQRWSLEVVSDEDRWVVEALIDPRLTVVGPITRGQTLWSVANQWPAAGAGEATAQAALMRWVAANPHAFIGDDPASLRQGALLVVPNQAYVERARAPLTPAAGSAPERDPARPAPSPGWVSPWWVLEGASPPHTLATGKTTADTIGHTSADTMAEPTQTETANTPGSFRLADEPGAIARLAWPVLSVMVGLMVLHGWAHRALGQPPPPARAVPVDAEIGPGSPELAWALAQWSARHHDRSQALHWLDEVIQHGSPKLARQAKRLVSQGAAGHETVDQKTGDPARHEDRSTAPAGTGQVRR
ncbi:MAG: hypothetical protein RI542_00035 [Wenzhouxiangella sp.]|nr:hypothetical protein [Wenzhouxiangella sp.]